MLTSMSQICITFQCLYRFLDYPRVGVQELLPKYAAQEPAKLAVWGLEEGNRLGALPVMQRPRFQLQNQQQGINLH